MLVKAAEREALEMFERLANVMDTQGLQERAPPTITIGCVASALIRFKSAYSPLYSGSTQRATQREVSGHPHPCVLRETGHYNPLIFSRNGKGSPLRWLRRV